MMSQPKSFGSLSGSLLARKGGARPAMRPQAFRFDEGDESAAQDDCGWNDMGADMLTPEQREQLLPAKNENITSIVSAPVREADEHDGGDAPFVHDQQRALEKSLSDGSADLEREADCESPADPVDDSEQAAYLARLQAEVGDEDEAETAEAAPARRKQPRAAPGSKAKAAFTLRLDKALHLKLRLACAFKHTSAQKLLTAALAEYLDRHHPDLPS